MSTVDSSTHHHAHHYESAEQEYQASKLGLWLFLATEILMFGGLFVGYAIFNSAYPEAFKAGAGTLDWKLGALNTVVLLVSSFTMALSIYYAQTNQKAKVTLNLWITFLCGAVFMGIKGIEYSAKISKGMLPGDFFAATGPLAEIVAMPIYYSFYFCMTGLHGSHVLVGMGLIFWLILRARKGEFNSKYYTPLECVGLFWHLVDLIWIYLFPMLYLVE